MLSRSLVALLAVAGTLLVQEQSSKAPAPAPLAAESGAALPATAAPVQYKGVTASNFDSRMQPLAIGNVGASLPTVVNTTLLKVSTGPVIASWTGELFGTDATADIIVAIEAIEYDVKNSILIGSPVLGSPGVENANPPRNFSLRVDAAGYASGSCGLQVVWPAGALTKGKTYQFNVRMADFSGNSTATTRLALLTVQAFKK